MNQIKLMSSVEFIRGKRESERYFYRRTLQGIAKIVSDHEIDIKDITITEDEIKVFYI